MSQKSTKKRSKSHVSIPAFKIEQSQKIAITANGGTFLLAELIKKMEMTFGDSQTSNREA